MNGGAGATDVERPTLGPAAAQGLAWLVVALCDLASISLLPFPVRHPGTRFVHYWFDVSQMAALGLLAATVSWGWRKLLGERRLLGTLGLAGFSLVLSLVVLAPDFHNWSERIERPWLAFVAAALASQSVSVALLVGRRLARPKWRLVGLGIGFCLLSMHSVLLPGDYPGIHAFWVFGAATLMAAAFAGMSLPRAASIARARPRLRLLLVPLAATGVASLVVWPPPTVATEIFQVSGSVLFPYLAKARSSTQSATSFKNDATSQRFIAPEWLASRERLPDIPASTPSIAPERPIVILLTIDALRFDVVEELRKAGRFPNVERLARESVEFTNARSPSSGTRHTMTSIFSSKYASSLRSKRGTYRDKGPKLPDFFRRAGFHTLYVSAADVISPRTGRVGRFDRELEATPSQSGQEKPLARDVLPIALRALEGSLDRPTFLYMHWLDPHHPYDSQGEHGSKKERQLREAEACDRQLGELFAHLEKKKVLDRVILVLTSDHGEAFGDHGIFAHGIALYEPLLRVPFFVRVPGVKPARIGAPVSGIDIGATLLDLIGADTPGSFMGQSLVPFLRGEKPALTRPIVADTGWVQSLVLGNYKIIDDARRNLVEVYDLSKDPGERDNLYGTLEGEDELMLTALRHFFATRRSHPPRRKTAKLAKRPAPVAD